MISFCWHKWGRWSRPEMITVGGITADFRVPAQARTCLKCCKINQRHIAGSLSMALAAWEQANKDRSSADE